MRPKLTARVPGREANVRRDTAELRGCGERLLTARMGNVCTELAKHEKRRWRNTSRRNARQAHETPNEQHRTSSSQRKHPRMTQLATRIKRWLEMSAHCPGIPNDQAGQEKRALQRAAHAALPSSPVSRKSATGLQTPRAHTRTNTAGATPLQSHGHAMDK